MAGRLLAPLLIAAPSYVAWIISSLFGLCSFLQFLETLQLIEPKQVVTTTDRRRPDGSVPDLLFDYEKDRLPPELEDLKPEEFLEEPDKPDLVFLPKKDLARICEMLSPMDFLALSQTCRFLHWRMMKFCHCSVENLKVYIRPEDRQPNGQLIHRIYSQMTSNLHRKQLLFHHVHFNYIVSGKPQANGTSKLALERTRRLTSNLPKTAPDVGDGWF